MGEVVITKGYENRGICQTNSLPSTMPKHSDSYFKIIDGLVASRKITATSFTLAKECSSEPCLHEALITLSARDQFNWLIDSRNSEKVLFALGEMKTLVLESNKENYFKSYAIKFLEDLAEKAIDAIKMENDRANKQPNHCTKSAIFDYSNLQQRIDSTQKASTDPPSSLDSLVSASREKNISKKTQADYDKYFKAKTNKSHQHKYAPGMTASDIQTAMPGKRRLQSNWKRKKSNKSKMKHYRVNRYQQKIPTKAGYAILFLALVVPIIMPNIFRLQYSSAISLANMSAPEGVPNKAFGHLPKEPVFQAIVRNGGSIILVSEIKGKDISIHSPAGAWDANIGAVKLKADNYDYETYLNTLKHEAIHMAQSCGNYSLNAEALPLGIGVTPEGVKELEPYRNTNPKYFASQVEREAYSNDGNNQEFIANLLDHYCGSNPWDIWMSKLKHPVQLWFFKQIQKFSN